MTPPRDARRAVGRVIAALGVLCLASCITLPKDNAPKTRVEERRSLEGEFGSPEDVAESSGTEIFTFEELRVLARDRDPGGELGEKLGRFWRTPIISNEVWETGGRPGRPWNGHLGEFLRVGTWNVEKSHDVPEVADALASEDAYLELLSGRPRTAGRRDELLRQRRRLAEADILLFQEMDIGVDRSGYIHAPELLADRLGMNYAYAPQQIELDPVLADLEAEGYESTASPDPARYRGIFGMAVLSRYPIRSATCFQLDSQPYDWYLTERKDHDAIEGLRRFGAEELFETPIQREVKLGGRSFFRVDLEVPGLPHDTLSVINVHLEIRARPEDRRRQMEEILGHIKGIPHPVVLAGDFNSSRYDLSPTSLQRVLARGSRDPDVWLFGGINLLVPAQSIYNTARTVLNELKNLYNPLAFNNPVIFPNETAELFEDLEAFRFGDGGRFDFRGSPGRSINRSRAALANSNEKALKGYRPTYLVRRPIGPFGRHRLDWMMVKSGFYTDFSESHRLAPHFGETLVAFGRPLKDRLSDHRPCVVDLPLRRPPGISER